MEIIEALKKIDFERMVKLLNGLDNNSTNLVIVSIISAALGAGATAIFYRKKIKYYSKEFGDLTKVMFAMEDMLKDFSYKFDKILGKK
ncbi:MAG: hypothetical protein ACRCX2_27080 [Paraclostridium sp.]